MLHEISWAKMVGFYKVLFNYDLQMQNMIEKLFCFLIEKYYNTAASYAALLKCKQQHRFLCNLCSDNPATGTASFLMRLSFSLTMS